MTSRLFLLSWLSLLLHFSINKSSTGDPCIQFSSSCTICTQHSNCRFCLLQEIEKQQYILSKSDGQDHILGRCVDIRDEDWDAPDQYPVIIDRAVHKVDGVCGLVIPDFLNGYTCLDAIIGATHEEYRKTLYQFQQAQSQYLKSHTSTPLIVFDRQRQTKNPIPNRLPEDLLFYFFVAPITISILICLSACVTQHCIRRNCCSGQRGKSDSDLAHEKYLDAYDLEEPYKHKFCTPSARISLASTADTSNMRSFDLNRLSSQWLVDDLHRGSNFSRISFNDVMENEMILNLSQPIHSFNMIPYQTLLKTAFDASNVWPSSQPCRHEIVPALRHTFDCPQPIIVEEVTTSQTNKASYHNDHDQYVQTLYQNYFKSYNHKKFPTQTPNELLSSACNIIPEKCDSISILRSKSTSAILNGFETAKDLTLLRFSSQTTSDELI